MALSQWKEAILEGIFMEIEDGVVEEKNLERLENLVEILHKEGSKVPESVKKAFCKVAVECTAKCLAYEKDAKKAYTEAIRSIWVCRIMPLCDKVSCLVTSDLLNSCRRLWTAHSDEKTCKSLMDENTRDKALVSLRTVVSELNPNLVGELNPNMDASDEIETSEESEETVSMVEARENEVLKKNSMASKAMDEDQENLSDTELERPTSGGSKDESLHRRYKTISSAIVDRALRKLRASKMELMEALEKGGPSNLNNESITEQENDVANPSGTNIAPRPSSMERRTTAQTYEWEDSIDDSDGELGGDGERNNKPKRKKIVMSPLKRNRSAEGARRKKVPWCTAETLAVLKGFEKYGANWKRIKDENPILVRRTNGDIKDKFRVEMRREERRP
ncbi:PREDICTED: uncharacterized protein LOC104739250 isoform X1 [Camelina sativa]|uniref:Uncharacterized protein LOC104739250 isoform X1 n=1 Tax=Camelina sativa TaxID=90675 RepID=A0ABM0VL37_CAMSA|nr:PREDICTED: uncharacterized protein LOC104739250 isoform X1 [Camelina sativa]